MGRGIYHTFGFHSFVPRNVVCFIYKSWKIRDQIKRVVKIQCVPTNKSAIYLEIGLKSAAAYFIYPYFCWKSRTYQVCSFWLFSIKPISIPRILWCSCCVFKLYTETKIAYTWLTIIIFLHFFKSVKNNRSCCIETSMLTFFFTDGDTFAYTLKQPVGVCGLIVPWNAPILMFISKVGTALAAGMLTPLAPVKHNMK